jgi:hypothetical protein
MFLLIAGRSDKIHWQANKQNRKITINLQFTSMVAIKLGSVNPENAHVCKLIILSPSMNNQSHKRIFKTPDISMD